MVIKLSDHFSYTRLARFVFPSIMMMVFLSIYLVVDGLFVSNFIGEVSFISLNLNWLITDIFSSLGFIFGTGGSAIVARTLGEKNINKANKIFPY